MGKHPKDPDRPKPKVGYCVPPDDHKFKKGHKGFGPRKKKAIDLHEMIVNAFMRETTVSTANGKVAMSRLEAMVNQLALQVANNPAKYLKANLPLIADALKAHAHTASTGVNEGGVDLAAAFRAKIERMAENLRLASEADGSDISDNLMD